MEPQPLPLTDFIPGNISLTRTFKTIDLGTSFSSMFCAHALMNSFAPQFKRTASEVLAHELDYFFFAQTKLIKYGFKGSSVFPGHADDPV
jgi:hypothetical protein